MINSNKSVIIAWWSAGITSAVACKLAIETYGLDNVHLAYFNIDTAHDDNLRFKQDCEKWYGKLISVYQSDMYNDQFEVIEKTKYINGVNGARCTLELKKRVRQTLESRINYTKQVFGFEYTKREVNRALRFLEQYPKSNPVFPLIEKKLTKNNCASILINNGIELPLMYKLGYSNNNCIGCVKGGKGYWNKIRNDFPSTFDRMANLERKIGYTCIKDKTGRVYLDELDPNAGRLKPIVMPDCGSFCDLEFTDVEHDNLQKVLDNTELIHQAA